MTAWDAALATDPATSAEPAPAEARLRMKPNTATRGHASGAWWPRSATPAVEFPGGILANNGVRATRQGHRA